VDDILDASFDGASENDFSDDEISSYDYQKGNTDLITVDFDGPHDRLNPLNCTLF